MNIQLDILMFLQSIRSPFLNILFLIFTISTEVPVIVLCTTLIYWCIDKKYGQRLLFSLIGNFVINTGIKEYIKAPRPIGTQGLESMRVSTATGYSFPSGHTQTATTFWASLMILLKTKWVYIVGSIMILAVGISRLYLGVHWPVDVVFGWIFGILFSFILIKIFDFVDENKNYWILILLLILLGVIGYLIQSESYIEYFGILTGFVLGYIVEDKFINFSTKISEEERINFSKNSNSENELTKIVKKFFIGLISLGIVYIFIKCTFTFVINYFEISSIDNFNVIFNYVRYVLLIFYGVAGVPALFKVLNLDN